MNDETIIKIAFVEACKYLQHNPPGVFETYSVEEIQACLGSGNYEDGWEQWAEFFINRAKNRLSN